MPMGCDLAVGCGMLSAWATECESGCVNAVWPARCFCPAAAHAASPCYGFCCCRAAAGLHRDLSTMNDVCAIPYPCKTKQQTK